MLNYEKRLIVSTSKFSSSTMLKHLPSTRWGLSHRPCSSSQYSHITNSLSSSDISYVHSWTLKIGRRQLPGNSTHISLLLNMQRVDFRSVESSFLNSHLTYMVGTPSLILRPPVMVATPPFPSALQISSTRKRRRSDPHDNSRHSSSLIYGGHTPSLIFRPSVMVVTPPSPSA